jgi:hypothetical protein
MITRDYFLRMIHMLAQVVARLLKLRETNQYDEAHEVIRQTSRQFLGMDAKLLNSLSRDELIRLLALGDRFDVEKCVVAAELLRMTAELEELQGKHDDSYETSARSLNLYLELLFRETGAMPEEFFEKVDLLVESLSSYDLPLELRQKLFRYYDHAGRYAMAEDILFDILGEDPGISKEGVRFYERLKGKTDEDLIRGNLPRQEVEAGLLELTKMIG